MRGLADAYGRGSRAYAAALDPTLEQMARDTMEITGVSAGHRVLDLASGTGAIARVAAAVEARVVAVDLSSGMMTTARRLAGPRIALAVADAAALPFRPRTFDAVTCGLSLSHFTNVRAVLAGVLQALRAGGVFVASTWGRSGRDRSYSAAFAVYKRYTGNLPRPFSTLLDEASWSDPDRGREIMAGSGFASADVITRSLAGTYPSALAALEWALAWPLTAAGLDQLEPARRVALRRDALAAIESEGDLHWVREVHYYRATAPGTSTSAPPTTV